MTEFGFYQFSWDWDGSDANPSAVWIKIAQRGSCAPSSYVRSPRLLSLAEMKSIVGFLTVPGPHKSRLMHASGHREQTWQFADWTESERQQELKLGASMQTERRLTDGLLTRLLYWKTLRLLFERVKINNYCCSAVIVWGEKACSLSKVETPAKTCRRKQWAWSGHRSKWLRR